MASKTYDLSMYENQKPARSADTDRVERKARAEQRRVRRQKRMNSAASILVAGVAALVLVFFLSNYVQLTELQDEVGIKQEQLRKLEEEGKSLQNDLAASTSTQNVETYAEEQFHMQPIDASQVQYITVGGGDQGESVKDANGGFLTEIAANISHFFSELAYIFF